jgi:hypothetical protein
MMLLISEFFAIQKTSGADQTVSDATLYRLRPGRWLTSSRSPVSGYRAERELRRSGKEANG